MAPLSAFRHGILWLRQPSKASTQGHSKSSLSKTHFQSLVQALESAESRDDLNSSGIDHDDICFKTANLDFVACALNQTGVRRADIASQECVPSNAPVAKSVAAAAWRQKKLARMPTKLWGYLYLTNS